MQKIEPLPLVRDPALGARIYYEERGLALIHGDCRQMVEVPSGVVDLVVTDPPFNVSFSTYGGGVDDSMAPALYTEWTMEWINECLRVLKPGGQLYAIMPYKWMPWWLPAIKHLRWHLLPWNKTIAQLHREKTYIRAWEPVLWIVKGDGPPNVFKRTYRFEQDKDWIVGGNAIGEAEGLRLKKKHPTPRPAWFYELYTIRASEPGMIVMDPMLGSGTGARVARKLGRRFVGYDINAEYLHIAEQLVAQASLELGPVEENVDAYEQGRLMQRWDQLELNRRVPFRDDPPPAAEPEAEGDTDEEEETDAGQL